MLIVISRPIKSVREKQRIRELILSAIAGISLPSICLDNIIFTFPERSQNRTKIKLITDLRSGEVIGAGEEAQIKTALCLALKPITDIREEDIAIRDFDVFDDYC